MFAGFLLVFLGDNTSLMEGEHQRDRSVRDKGYPQKTQRTGRSYLEPNRGTIAETSKGRGRYWSKKQRNSMLNCVFGVY